MDTPIYRAKEVYTREKFDDMGRQLNRVKDSSGMIRAALTDDEFETLYEEIVN